MSREKATEHFRVTSQPPLPSRITPSRPGTYDLYPGFPVANDAIALGYPAIADRLAGHPCAVIDGYVGVLWGRFKDKLDAALAGRGITTEWIDASDAMLSGRQISELKHPFLGGDDPVFGTRYQGELADFFDHSRLKELAPDSQADLSILYGCGAALAGWPDPLLYLDVPKNELQYRSRAGSIANLGRADAGDPKAMYKEFYFVDWVVLNRHKAALSGQVDWIVDAQRPDEPALMSGEDFRAGLKQMSKSVFRPRPWFEPGVWGGQWCRKHIPDLPQEVPNYAWSFEMIVPENGLIFCGGGEALEVSFDWLMYQEHEAVLGDAAGRFGHEFPIRFDFLDTFDGGNLSLQCHPRPDYMRTHFGELFTQDETYYILDCKPGARVYLGFREDIKPDRFRQALERGAGEGTKVEVEEFVLSHPARRHELFLIPSGTIHCSGTDNMVLEISATPYIFTFKMYDWQRVGLDGQPRPINIGRAFENLCFDRKGRQKIEKEFISTPRVIEEGKDWRLVHLPTHPEHFYDVHRYEFAGQVEAETQGSCHVMSLVEGESILVETANEFRRRVNFAETFTVPAAAGSYRLVNDADAPAKVVKAFIKS